MKTKTLIISLIIIVVGTMIIYRINSNRVRSSSKPGEPAKKVAVISGEVITPRKFSNQLSLSGSVEANEQVEIRSEVSGIVQGIYFEEGGHVSEGQTLIKVSDLELKAQLAQAKTREQLTSENERRASLLLEKEAISQEEYDVSVAEYKSAQAQTQLIEAQLAKTTIKAPFSGKIGLRNISSGTYVTPATLITKLVNLDKVKIAFSMPEKYANNIRENSEITFTTSSTKEIFKARVYAVEPEVEATTRTVQLKAIADNVHGKLIPGTFANIELPLEEINNAILIPTEAVIPIQNGKKVFISENGTAKEILIETSTRTNKDILVLTGLKAGDTLLTSGVMTLRNGAPVRVKLTIN